MIAICTYCLDRCNANEIIDVVTNHEFALIKREGKWEQIESSKQKQAEEALRITLESIGDGFFACDADWKFVYVNAQAERILGIRREEVLGKSHWERFPLTIGTNLEREYRRAAAGEIRDFENFYEPWGRWFHNRCFPREGGGMSVYFEDITERKQEERRIFRYNRVLEGINRVFSNVVQAKTEEELGNECLSVALEVTGSQFGFVGEIGADGLLRDIAISDMGWAQCLMYDKIGHRRPPGNFVLHGLYGHVIKSGKGFFTNDPQSHPHSIGLPSGHPSITSFLGVPLVLDGKIKGVIAVANREGGYSYEQLEDLEAIAPAVVQALNRKKSEEALHEAYENLQVQSVELQAQSEEIQMQYEELQAANEELQVQSEELQAQSEELVEAYEALYESEKRYRLLFDHSLDAILLTDPRNGGKILSANPAACHMFGWPEEELIGKGRDFILNPDDPALSAVLNERSHSGSAMVQLTYKRKDGATFIGELSTTLFTDINGEPHSVAIIRDITEKNRLKKHCRKAKQNFVPYSVPLQKESFSQQAGRCGGSK